MASHLVWALAVLAAISYPAAANLGQQVGIQNRPSIVQIEVRVGTVWVQQCGASVLTSLHVLTNARCTSGSLYTPDNRRVRAGTSERGGDGWLVQVNYAINHPNYGVEGSDSDIAVVRLAFGLPLGSNVEQAFILAQGTILPAGLPVQAYGWGSTIQGAQPSDRDLYRLGLLIQPIDRCAAAYPNNPVTENMICAGLSSGGRDFDARDVGAPLVYDNIVVGIISFGTTSGDVTPVVATSIAKFSNWIVSNVY